MFETEIERAAFMVALSQHWDTSLRRMAKSEFIAIPSPSIN
jgi:hypothetical protein